MPNMWRSDGTPCYDPPAAEEYVPQPRWERVPSSTHRSWTGIPITAEEDFREPYIDGWDLI